MKARTATDRRPPSACAGSLSGWATAAALLLALTTACAGPAPGDRAAAGARPGAAGAGDRLFPQLGNGGYDVAHYGLTLDYVPETNHLRGTAVITARATQDLSDLDLSGLRVRAATVQGASAQVARSGDELSNGELIRQEAEGDTMTRHWRTEEPMASYLAHVSVGCFETHKGWTHDHVPVHVAVDPDESRDATAVADLVPEIVDWAGGRFGPYPFSSTGAVVDHLPGLDYALETQTRPYFAEAPDEAVLVHELAHQWFGNSVTPRAWKDMWLSEGLATYSEWLWEEKRGGRSTDEIFESFYDGTDAESEGIWAFPPAAPPSAGRVSDPPVYGRGAMVVHKVREAVGDETFFGILRTWTRRHRHGNAGTRQFVTLCENESGKDLTGLFGTWLFGERKPSRM
ncbi:M1 family metallopeptidase [Streptomyces sp. NPDC047813]|uniref:M1 family metallopeptidase n=1 Tax=Streptomyces sp. NPDC047813 TaxID=3154608 RepID=UPI0033DC92FA